ncbi:hypothetical protein [Acetonema longum]|uniref:Uncharacterized protein n=1 Tax=Acetonema longum DSM 6540 TaxID=1009370 RepID=F7NKB8_9FIRM|nr:hypothetical protein [Acetonema longum]EGO63559.1 hypothetical protein ALO_12656 [Acetonema longum DSM 6540]
MTLDEHIYSCSGTEHGLELKRLLQELKHRRETEIRPATRFLGNTLLQQIGHVQSENLEEKKALEWYLAHPSPKSKEEYAMELVDGQMSRETELAILGYDDKARAEVRRKVIEKNAARGYYEDAR